MLLTMYAFLIKCPSVIELAGDSEEKLRVFLEIFLQEMPKAHLELLYSGSVCVTERAF